jgi:hypothetical protein
MNWMSGATKRRCERALYVPAPPAPESTQENCAGMSDQDLAPGVITRAQPGEGRRLVAPIGHHSVSVQSGAG